MRHKYLRKREIIEAEINPDGSHTIYIDGCEPIKIYDNDFFNDYELLLEGVNYPCKCKRPNERG